MLRGEREQTGHSEGDSCRNCLGLYPERNPGHDDDQAGGHIRVEQVIPQAALEGEHHLQTGELACKRVGRVSDRTQ